MKNDQAISSTSAGSSSNYTFELRPNVPTPSYSNSRTNNRRISPPQQQQITQPRQRGRRSTKRGQIDISDILELQRPNIQQHRQPASRRIQPKVKVNEKWRFVNSNYRFVVNPLSSYTLQSMDPDIPIPWEDVYQVLTFHNDPCPICLMDIVAPRMSSCGHSFCLSCVLMYMDIPSDNGQKRRWKKCPICAETSINVDSMKGVRGTPSVDVVKDERLEMVLCARKGGSTLSLPVGSSPPSSKGDLVSVDVESDIKRHVRLLAATKEYLHSEKYRERIDLLERREQDPDSFEYYEKAMDLLDNQFNLPTTPLIDLSHDSNNGNTYIFYKAVTGQHLFLSSLDIKILLAEFGSYSNFPYTINPVVNNIHRTTIDAEIRKHKKYLSHLPIGAEIVFMEVDLTDVVKKETLDKFSRELRERVNARLSREKREERERIKGEKYAERQLIHNSPIADMEHLTIDDRSNWHFESSQQWIPSPQANEDNNREARRPTWAAHDHKRDTTHHEEEDFDIAGWNEIEENAVNTSTAGSGSGKKKKKRLVLLSTSSNRGN